MMGKKQKSFVGFVFKVFIFVFIFVLVVKIIVVFPYHPCHLFLQLCS